MVWYSSPSQAPKHPSTAPDSAWGLSAEDLPSHRCIDIFHTLAAEGKKKELKNPKVTKKYP